MAHRILLIDDEQDVLAATSEYLREVGYEVDCAQEREEAEALLEHLTYSIVITDLGLSKFKGLQGLDIASQIKQNLPKTRTIVMSGHCEPEVQNEASGKIDAFLAKPVSLPELSRLMSKLLEKQ
jgi:CheY-like chemotaxis protein